MSAENFSACLSLVLKEEGGNDDDPHDHGGRTSRGITQREYDAYRQLKSLPAGDVWLASQDEINEIYKTQYWNPYCDGLPTGLDLVFFDFCVNAGRQQAVKSLQRALGISADGMFGIATKNAVDGATDIGGLIHSYSENRRKFYQALRQFSRYGRGWIARTNRIEKAAAAMAGTVAFATGLPVESPKADANDIAKPTVSPEAGAATATSSTVGVGVMDQIQEATSHIAQFQDTIHIVKYILIAVALIGFGFTVYGILHRRRTAEAIG